MPLIFASFVSKLAWTFLLLEYGTNTHSQYNLANSGIRQSLKRRPTSSPGSYSYPLSFRLKIIVSLVPTKDIQLMGNSCCFFCFC